MSFVDGLPPCTPSARAPAPPSNGPDARPEGAPDTSFPAGQPRARPAPCALRAALGCLGLRVALVLPRVNIEGCQLPHPPMEASLGPLQGGPPQGASLDLRPPPAPRMAVSVSRGALAVGPPTAWFVVAASSFRRPRVSEVTASHLDRSHAGKEREHLTRPQTFTLVHQETGFRQQRALAWLQTNTLPPEDAPRRPRCPGPRGHQGRRLSACGPARTVPAGAPGRAQASAAWSWGGRPRLGCPEAPKGPCARSAGEGSPPSFFLANRLHNWTPRDQNQ